MFVQVLSPDSRPYGRFQFIPATQGNISLPTTTDWINGTYQILFANVIDDNSSLTYFRGDSSGVITAAMDFQVTGGVNNPVVAPLTAFSMTTPVVRHIGDPVTFLLTLGQGTSAIKQVQVNLIG